MLVLTRKVEQEIVCEELGITIKIISIQHAHSVKIGIEAPRHLTFHRKEIQEKINLQLPNQITDPHSGPVQICKKDCKT
jgi:carbon storage regulator CsrA